MLQKRRQFQITQTKYDTFPHLDRRHIFTKYGETFVGLLKNYTNCQNVKFNLAFMSETRKTTKHTHIILRRRLGPNKEFHL